MKQSKPAAVLFGTAYLSRVAKKESVSASAQPQVLRADTKPKVGPATTKQCEKECDHSAKFKNCVKPKKESVAVKKQIKRESAKVKFTGRLREQNGITSMGDGVRFSSTLLQEGMGNLGDCYYYTADAIRSAPPIFEGKKFFVDHPTSSEEVEHPERSVRDVAGYFENLSVAVDDTGRSSLIGDVVVMKGQPYDQIRALMLESIDFAKKHPGQYLVGLSINANGDFETVPMEQFLTTESIPDPCKTKIMEAMAEGITTIKPVREMKSAFSCDLVTEPGAGGSINTLLEGKKQMAKQAKQEEEEAKKMEAQKQKEGDKDGGAAGDDKDHPDAEQDKKLIAQQLKKHLGLGDDDEPSEEESKLMHEAYENSMEMGLKHEEAMKCAEHNLKMAKHMQSKQKEAAGDEPESKVKPKAVGDAGSVSKKDQVESNRHRDVKLTAEVASLRAKLDSMERKEFLDKTLRESKLPMAATKKLRECLVNAKTQAEITEKLNVFKEAYRLGGEADGGGLILGAEKSYGTATEGGIDFSDCVSNE
jgi:hypothetical protein